MTGPAGDEDLHEAGPGHGGGDYRGGRGVCPPVCHDLYPDPEVQHWAVVNLRIEIVCQLFYAGMFTYNTLATGSGHTVFIMWNSFLNCIVVRLILAVVLEHFLGIYGVYIACGVAVASSVPVGWWFYRSKRWMTMKNIH